MGERRTGKGASDQDQKMTKVQKVKERGAEPKVRAHTASSSGAVCSAKELKTRGRVNPIYVKICCIV